METEDGGDNFLSRFAKEGAEQDWEDVADDYDERVDAVRGDGTQALAGSWEKLPCQECGEQDEENGGGRYGVDDHEGFFYCGHCWRAWDGDDKANIMKPAWQQRKAYKKTDVKEHEDGNFFDQYEADAEEGTDDIEGAWNPDEKGINENGDQALPGSWERPICIECNNDEGEEGGGRYGHGPDSEKFFCGRCWKSWDRESQRRMMMAYGPANRLDFQDRHAMDPMLHVPPPNDPMTQEDPWRQPDDMEMREGNFFDEYKADAQEGTDDIEGAWNPDHKDVNENGDQALPGSWERPICVECGNDEGEEGGGRYGHGPDNEKFFCGRCWKSWDCEAQQKMMMAYSPGSRFDVDDRHAMDPMLHAPPDDPMKLDPAFYDIEMRGDADDEEIDGEDEEGLGEAGEEEELRFDGYDGPFSYTEFLEFYEDEAETLARWEAAVPAYGVEVARWEVAVSGDDADAVRGPSKMEPATSSSPGAPESDEGEDVD